jgi:hypothetical protein
MSAHVLDGLAADGLLGLGMRGAAQLEMCTRTCLGNGHNPAVRAAHEVVLLEQRDIAAYRDA